MEKRLHSWFSTGTLELHPITIHATMKQKNFFINTLYSNQNTTLQVDFLHNFGFLLTNIKNWTMQEFNKRVA